MTPTPNSATTYDQAYWGDALNAAFEKTQGTKRPIRLPKDRPNRPNISIRGKPAEVTMTLNAAAVASNMQDDCAAFEAWALALWTWAGVKRIVLDWEVPAVADMNGHYQRFLFRAQNMLALFPAKFDLCRHDQELLPFDRVNVPSYRKPHTADDLKDSKLEAQLEHHLVHDSSWLMTTEGLTGLSSQFPVGTFMGEVSKKNAVFTGGKSAIDMVGWKPERNFIVYELKAGNNIPLGIVSELLFYCSMMDWLKGTDMHGGHPVDNKTRTLPQYENLFSCERITGVFLAPKFHPLLVPDTTARHGTSLIIDELNNAWNNWADKAVAVDFRWLLVPGNVHQAVAAQKPAAAT